MYPVNSLNMDILGTGTGIMNGDLKKYRNYTRLVAVLDVLLATLGFFFNPFNDEETDVPFLYWKITITCLIFEIWMIVSINLFVATQKLETQQNPKKSIKYCNYWLTIATLAFIVFQAIIVFPPPTGASSPNGAFGTNPMLSNINDEPRSSRRQIPKGNPYMELYWPSGILIYRIFATLVVVKYKGKLRKYSNNNTVVSNPQQEFDLDLDGDGDLTESLDDPVYLSAMASAYPDLLTHAHAVAGYEDGGITNSDGGKCHCGNSLITMETEGGKKKQSQKFTDNDIDNDYDFDFDQQNLHLQLHQQQLQELEEQQQQLQLAMADQGINFYLNPSNSYLIEHNNSNNVRSTMYSDANFFQWNPSAQAQKNTNDIGSSGGYIQKLNFSRNKTSTDASVSSGSSSGSSSSGNGNSQSVQV